MFKPSRLILARQRRRLTQLKLAEMIDCASETIRRYESGLSEPNHATIEVLARVLDFPTAFFVADDVEPVRAETASFRAMKSLTARDRDAALGSGCIALEFNRWVERRFKLQPANVPDGERMNPEVAADAVRAHWKLGEQPIPNLVHLLELHGVRVFSLAEDCREVNAFSFWRSGTPFVFLNTMKSPERARYDAAHELGHLVLHREGEKGRDIEREADIFASVFLMPAGSVKASAPRAPQLPALIEAKRYWNVSLAALVHRMHDVKLLTDWHYRTLYVTLSKLGYRTREPNGSHFRETSQVWTKVFASLRADGLSKADVARELRIPARELDAIVFGLVQMGSIEGGGARRPGRAHRPSKRPLRLLD